MGGIETVTKCHLEDESNFATGCASLDNTIKTLLVLSFVGVRSAINYCLTFSITGNDSLISVNSSASYLLYCVLASWITVWK